MNVLFLINYAGKGGTEKYVKMLSEMLLEKGDKVFFAYNESGPLALEMECMGAEVFRLPMKSPYDLKAAQNLALICKSKDIDIVHTQFARENYIAVFSKIFGNRASVIHTSHINLENNAVWKTANKLVMNKNSAIIAVCESVKKHLISNNYPADKIQTIHNGIAYRPIGERDLSVRAEFSVNEFLFVTLTRFTKEKGTLFLLKSALKLREITDKPFKLLFAGDGELLEEARNFVLENHMTDDIIFAGYRVDAEKILEAADCFINSSESEASSFAIFEAMGKALPVIATDVGGNPDIINEKTNCGILVSYGEEEEMAGAMAEMLENPQKAKALGENAIHAVKDIFNIEIGLEKIYGLYRKAIS